VRTGTLLPDTGPRRSLACAAALFAALLLSGCGGAGLWPFGGGEVSEQSRRPANATEYRCEAGRSFYVRRLDDGAVWLIAPDREIRLPKLSGDGRWGIGRVELLLSGDEATLLDPPTQFAGCRRAGAKS